MDDGYKMLQHVVRQVFGNLGQAVRLTLFLTAAPMLLLVWLSAQTVPGPDGMPMPEYPGFIFLVSILNLILSAWAAVGWHRFVLREEYGAGIVPQWHGQNVKSYIGRLIILVLVMILIVLAIGIASGALILATQSVLVIWFVAIGIAMGISWVAVRIGLILPAAALGEKMRIAESWQATKPVSTDILVPIVIIAISITVLSGAVEAIFGSTLVGLVLVAGVYWIQILLNLSLMTTVYGMQIEGRSLS
ncbi:hypothetical protein [Alterinioella nitratireducens]|uniref:hypothetical protein n=1 Tax=Alterinioella nitratireducens TaxID=2735915 RepID=UPI0015565540|nr:hypothetical protein [Alterinioella nitratireducens]NPD18752.1 hypothetical protein [Alterinioella nitratireducens]|tara:strand:+ start:451 stop:1191 length:741 start_codon:yes stop_codon:yes gene_type:complete